MASRGLQNSYAVHYEASSTQQGASSLRNSTVADPPAAPPAASAATSPAAGCIAPDTIVNPPAARSTADPSVLSYLRHLGTLYSFPSSTSSLPTEGPLGTVMWQSSNPAVMGASLAVPPPLVPGPSFYQQPSSARQGALLVSEGTPTFPADSFVPGTEAAARPRLLPPLCTQRGWLGGGRFSTAAFTAEDMPGFNSLRRGIVLCVMLLLISSLFACIGRADFNFVLYLLGYHLWCVESDTKSVTGLKRLIRGARQYAILLCIAAVVDTTWLFIAYSTWVCEQGDPDLCFPEPENLKVRWAYGIHNWALCLSTFNLLLKLLVIFFSFAWVQQQRTALGLGGGGPMPGGTSILPPSFE